MREDSEKASGVAFPAPVLRAAPGTGSGDVSTSTKEQRRAVTDILEKSMMGGHENFSRFLRTMSDGMVTFLHRYFIEDGGTSNAWEVAWLAKDDESERTIREYLLMHDLHADSTEELGTTAHYLRGLHLIDRNRESMDPEDPKSVAQNRALLRFAIAAANVDSELETSFLDYRTLDPNDWRTHGLAIEDDGLVDLICDHPDRVEELVELVTERGTFGVELFRQRLESANVLDNGKL